MSRKSKKHKKEYAPDPVHGDVLVARLINRIMLDGKKNTASKIVYSALDTVGEKTGEDPLSVFNTAVENLKPSLEVRSRRVGGSTYQVPVDVRPARRLSLALRWLVSYSRQRGEKGISGRLSSEIIDAYNKRGNAMKKKEDVYKMAESNRAFAHYNW